MIEKSIMTGLTLFFRSFQK